MNVLRKLRFTAMIVVPFSLVIIGCNDATTIQGMDTYAPSEDFKAAFGKIDTHPEVPADEVDIERVMQFLRAVDLAQERSGDWQTFLLQLAQFDYTGIPDEVLEIERKLFPILESMKKLDDEYASNNLFWETYKAMSKAQLTLLKELDVDSVRESFNGVAGDPLAFLNNKNRDALVHMAESGVASMDAYEKKREDIKRRLEEINKAYVSYIREIAPLRRRYQKEWDALCLTKDRAYLEVYHEKYSDALQTTSRALQENPGNRDMLILRSFALVQSALTGSASNRTEFVVSADNPHVVEALDLLGKAVKVQPGSSAPALVMRGYIECCTGNSAKSRATLDLASMEYPRQARKLIDTFEAYASRRDVEKTAEGQCLLRLYRAINEGNGLFSPNLQKALLLEKQKRLDESRDEIYNHFFRRGNQDALHGLFSDMEFCEHMLSYGYKSFLPENCYIDASLKSCFNSTEYDLELLNRTDITLSNVRIYMCLQYTGMYHGEYDVVNIGSVGKLGPLKAFTVDNTKINRGDKSFKDIADYRVILMTDKQICWVDSAESKRENKKMILIGKRTPHTITSTEKALSQFGTSVDEILSALRNTTVTVKKGFMTDDVALEIPCRNLLLLNPIFSVGRLDQKPIFPSPKDNYLEGETIKCLIDLGHAVSDGENCELYISCDSLVLRLNLEFSSRVVDGKTLWDAKLISIEKR